MNRYIKIMVLSCLLIVLLCFMCIATFAHSPGTTFSDYGSETKGWIIRPAHHNANKSLTYQYDTSDTFMTVMFGTLYRNMFTNGAAKWTPCGASITQSSSSVNLVGTYFDSGTSTNAWCGNYTYNSTTKHTTKFEIRLNRHYHDVDSSSSYNESTVAHEFGHAFGLLDLYNSSNQTKLMYGYTNRAINPTICELSGLNSIANGN